MDFMELLKALILGLIQGLTEFLPVSSSGHLELGKEILQVDTSEDAILFSVLVHGATALSTMVIYRKTIIDLIKGLFQFKWNESTQYVAFIVLSMIPVAVIGLTLEDHIEELFQGRILLVGLMLLVTGGLLYITIWAKDQAGKINASRAAMMGIAQAIAILPGISRSGSTISTALMTGMSREEAARFSFLMVLPPILGATALKFKDYLETVDMPGTSEAFSPAALVVGFLAAFISGLLACTWMIRLVKNSKLQYFAWYCFVVGAGAIVYSFVKAP